MEQEFREKILESTHIPKEMWDSCIVTSDGQVFTPNDETGESAEEAYNKHLSNIGKGTPSQMEVLTNKISNLESENKLLNAQIQATISNQEFLENCLIEMAMTVYA